MMGQVSDERSGSSHTVQWQGNPPQGRRRRRCGFHPSIRRIPRRRTQQPPPVCWPGESLRERSWWATVHRVTKSWKELSGWARMPWALQEERRKRTEESPLFNESIMKKCQNWSKKNSPQIQQMSLNFNWKFWKRWA